MSVPATTPRTVEELYSLPDDGLRYELRAGWLVSEPLPGFEHGRIAAKLAWMLHAYVRDHDLGAVLACDSGFVLARSPDTVRGPDVAFVSKQRLALLDDPAKAFPGAPDLAVEIASPSQTAEALHAKVADYLAAGTRVVWVVDPHEKCVSVYRTLLSPRRLTGDDRVEAEGLLPGFGIAARELYER